MVVSEARISYNIGVDEITRRNDMTKFYKATVSYGSSDYPMTELHFPKTLQDPPNQVSLVEAAVSRQHPNWKFKLEYFHTPAFPDFNVPAFHVFICNGIRIAYVD